MPRKSHKQDSKSAQARAPSDSLPAVDADLAALALRARLRVLCDAFPYCYAPWRSVRLPEGKNAAVRTKSLPPTPRCLEAESCALPGSDDDCNTARHDAASISLHLLPHHPLDQSDAGDHFTRSTAAWPRRVAPYARHAVARTAHVAFCLACAALCAAVGAIPLLSWCAFWALGVYSTWPYALVMLFSGLVGCLATIFPAFLAVDVLRWASDCTVRLGNVLMPTAAPAAELTLTAKEWQLRRRRQLHWHPKPVDLCGDVEDLLGARVRLHPASSPRSSADRCFANDSLTRPVMATKHALVHSVRRVMLQAGTTVQLSVIMLDSRAGCHFGHDQRAEQRGLVAQSSCCEAGTAYLCHAASWCRAQRGTPGTNKSSRTSTAS